MPETALHVHLLEGPDHTVVEVLGDLDHFTAPQLRHALSTLAPREVAAAVLDLTGCTFLDAGGLHVLQELRDGRCAPTRFTLRPPVGPALRTLELVGAQAWLPAEPRAAASAPQPRARRASGRLLVSPGPWPEDHGDAMGFWIVAGLVHRQVTLHRSHVVDLLGPRDLLVLDGPEDDVLGARTTCTALTQVEAVPLDGALLSRLQARPQVLGRLLAQAGAQQQRMAVHRAVVQLPRVEERLLALLWLLAERWGRVGPDGVVVPVRLSHEVLGRLVGARRPTVSVALKALVDAGKLSRRPDGSWLIDPATQDDLGAEVDVPALPKYLLDQPAELQAGAGGSRDPLAA